MKKAFHQDRWIQLMQRLGLDNHLATFAELETHYQQSHRQYHNANHIEAVLTHLDNCESLANNLEAVETALWFHDAIYKPFSSTNELDSANWAADFLRANKVDEAFIQTVHQLIMATLHTHETQDNDEQLIVDIDLAILGCAPELYAKFEHWVRREYKWIPRFIYRNKRKEVLTQFLGRERIYSHAYFYDRYEHKAKANLAWAIEQL